MLIDIYQNVQISQQQGGHMMLVFFIKKKNYNVLVASITLLINIILDFLFQQFRLEDIYGEKIYLRQTVPGLRNLEVTRYVNSNTQFTVYHSNEFRAFNYGYNWVPLSRQFLENV